MIFPNKIKFKLKRSSFYLNRLYIKNIKAEYIDSLNKSRFLKFKKKHTLKSQKLYIKKINASLNNFILGIYKNKKLVGTMNVQTYKKLNIGNKKFKNIVSFGILIFNKYQKMNIGKNSIKNISQCLSQIYNNVFSTIDRRNNPSIKAFKYAGFKQMKYKKGNTLFFKYHK